MNKPNSSSSKIAFIGAGNMASSIIGGLLTQGFAAEQISASDPFPQSLEKLQGMGLSATTSNNHEAIANADVIVLAVKPQVLKEVCIDLAPVLSAKNPLVISIAAGIGLQSLSQWLEARTPIVRCMPNTPALVQLSATGLYANDKVSKEQKEMAESILGSVGITLWVNSEEDLHAVTAVSGSGPAYFFLVIEAMTKTGVKLGLTQEMSETLALQTAKGAAEMAQTSDVGTAELRRRVTSPGGTTEQAVKTFEDGGLLTLFEDALTACAKRSRELAKELGGY